MTIENSSTMTVGSDNVFQDLGFEAEEAMNLKIRADLMIKLCDHIESQEWTRQEAAESLKESQLTISALMNGEIEQFNVDKLIGMLGKAGKQVKVIVTL